MGLPHSEILGSQLVCSSPRLIAAYHVLHRLPVPRHPPCALTRLISVSRCDSSTPHTHSSAVKDEEKKIDDRAVKVRAAFEAFHPKLWAPATLRSCTRGSR